MKELKDYLHLYLGCECIGYYRTKDGNTGEEVIVELRKTLVSVSIDGFDLNGNLKVEEFKPILRPLSDMTEEEVEDYMGLVCVEAKPFNQFAINAAMYTKWLLSKHFDLFGLIDAGLATDKTKIAI